MHEAPASFVFLDTHPPFLRRTCGLYNNDFPTFTVVLSYDVYIPVHILRHMLHYIYAECYILYHSLYHD
jgi:hypothetical protein